MRLTREVKTVVNRTDFVTIYCIKKELLGACKSFDSLTRDDQFFMLDDEQLKRRKEQFITILNRIKSTVALNPLKRNEAAGFDVSIISIYL